jgi:hypothetical protein
METVSDTTINGRRLREDGAKSMKDRGRIPRFGAAAREQQRAGIPDGVLNDADRRTTKFGLMIPTTVEQSMGPQSMSSRSPT